MLLWIKIGVLYGAPVLAMVLAMLYFVVLLLRVRRGAVTPAKAAARYPLALLLAPATVLVVWGTAEIASYLSVASGRYVWDAGAAWDVLVSLLPIAGYVAAPIALLVVAFWVTLALHTKGTRGA
jgi:hypothetical protein